MAVSIDLEFADGEYTFALPLARIDELQRKTGAGIGALFARVLKGATSIDDDVVLAPEAADFHVLDLIESIRQGLIGGGRGVVDGQEVQVTAVVARRLVDKYVVTRPLTEAWALAAAILGAVVVGYDPAGSGKKKSHRDREGQEGKDAGEGHLNYGLVLTNCAMMNIPPGDVERLSLREYEALLHHWNAAHGGGDDVQAPDHGMTQKLIGQINTDPALYTVATKTLH